MTITCERKHLDQRIRLRGADPAAVEACVRVRDDGLIDVDTEHPAYPKAAPQTSAILESILSNPVVDRDRTLRRRTICLSCEHVNDVQETSAHCRKKGARSQCPSCRVSWHSSPDLTCPLGKWDAKPPAPPPAPVKFGSNIGKSRPGPTPPADAVDFPIDLVLTWVDGADPTWRAKYQAATGKPPADGTRWASADELKYALRSVDRFAPWINHIWIVTDAQRPAWLADHPKVSIIDHRQIIDARHLPTFNSNAIEIHLHKIDGLAEHFLYANDDMVFAAPTEPGHWFTSDGKAIVKRSGHVRSTKTDSYSMMKNNAADLLDELLVPQPWQCGWHHIKPYTRAMMAEVARRIPATLDQQAGRKVRSGLDVAWNDGFWPAFSIAAGYAVPAKQPLDEFYVNAADAKARETLTKSIQRMPHVLCLNNASAKESPLVREFLDAYFPSPSPFEARPHWVVTNPQPGACVVVGVDQPQEDLLPWFAANVRRHNPDLPILIADFGMSDAGRRTAEGLGKVIAIPRVNPRHAWFGKPWAMLQATHAVAIWMDVDCEVRGDLSPLWTDYLPDHGIALAPDPPQHRRAPGMGNSGVVVARHGEPAIAEWAYACAAERQRRGDQDVLYALKPTTKRLPQRFNLIRLVDGYPDAPDAVIVHHTGGEGKAWIRAVISGPAASKP